MRINRTKKKITDEPDPKKVNPLVDRASFGIFHPCFRRPTQPRAQGDHINPQPNWSDLFGEVAKFKFYRRATPALIVFGQR